MNMIAPIPDDEIARAADEAAGVMRALSNPARLRLLCALVGGEQTVGELESTLDAPQAYVSGQLARLRSEGLVACRRDGRRMLYTLADPRVTPVLETLYKVFCSPSKP